MCQFILLGQWANQGIDFSLGRFVQMKTVTLDFKKMQAEKGKKTFRSFKLQKCVLFADFTAGETFLPTSSGDMAM